MPQSSFEWSLSLKNWRGIPHLEWSPFGVSLLTGPNGSGKTSVLSALRFLCTAYTQGVIHAATREGSLRYLRRMDAGQDEPIEIALSLGSLRWNIQLIVDGHGIHDLHGEQFVDDGTVLLSRAPLGREWYDQHGTKRNLDKGTCLYIAKQLDEDPRFERFTEFLNNIRVYGAYGLYKIREPDISESRSEFLHPTGRNLYPVLMNWKSSSRAYEGRFEWVLEQVKRAFPDQIEGMEFEMNARMVFAGFYPPHSSHWEGSLPLSVAADGLLTGILHLTAVAGAKDNAVIAFDEMENQLHPHAIRSILSAMRERAEEKNLTILLTTHSPVVMNEFKGYEDQFFVLHANQKIRPTALDELEDPDWLAHFSLGDLYTNEKIAAPFKVREPR